MHKDTGPEHAHSHAGEAGALEGGPAFKRGEIILTLRPGSGISGDMILGGLAALAGLDNPALEGLIAELGLPELAGGLKLEPRSVNSVSGVGCAVTLPHEHAHRSFKDIEKIIRASALPPRAQALSLKAFALLAEAEGAVHGKKAQEVCFHEVGALDSILDTCLAARIFTILAPAHFICGPLPLADGVISCAHGKMPSPAPAVLRLLNGVPVRDFAGQGETVTPTGLALLKALGASFGPWPPMTVEKTVISYGSKIFPNAPNGALWALGHS
ncbi:LarC family nickel insertion protein [Desulfovibrio sp. OttesenSCG-928-C14]|nr:LarC family nickel insertion protein [Desulfovibrio sp. OttesenSCG-928-C14]